MKTWRFLFKCFFLYKSRFCGFQDLYVHYVQRFVSRDKTLRLQSYFFFLFLFLFGRGAQKHPPLCLIFVQYPSIWTISCCIKPEALPEAFNRPSLWGFYVFCSFIFFFLHHWPLRVSDTGLLLNAFNVLLALVFRSFIKVILHRGPFFGFLFLWVDCVSTPTHSSIKEVFESI